MSELEFDCGWLNTPQDPGDSPEPVRFHIDGLLPTTGVVLLVGETNTGKSSWVLDLLFKLCGALYSYDEGDEGGKVWWGTSSVFLALEGADYTREAWQSFVRDTPEHEMLDGAHRYRNDVLIATPHGFDISNLEHVDALKREIVAGASKSSISVELGGRT